MRLCWLLHLTCWAGDVGGQDENNMGKKPGISELVAA